VIAKLEEEADERIARIAGMTGLYFPGNRYKYPSFLPPFCPSLLSYTSWCLHLSSMSPVVEL